ncbi:unnamed protein product [Hermetia illucens]|uniref:Uncharacterized protein n=1 Tax=Hermetia illucens TaxID=343691 RepID=A0A7R8YUS4_HERIL|nr:unnamed protein product [Hermetia illucens]
MSKVIDAPAAAANLNYEAITASEFCYEVLISDKEAIAERFIHIICYPKLTQLSIDCSFPSSGNGYYVVCNFRITCLQDIQL